MWYWFSGMKNIKFSLPSGCLFNLIVQVALGAFRPGGKGSGRLSFAAWTVVMEIYSHRSGRFRSTPPGEQPSSFRSLRAPRPDEDHHPSRFDRRNMHRRVGTLVFRGLNRSDWNSLSSFRPLRASRPVNNHHRLGRFGSAPTGERFIQQKCQLTGYIFSWILFKDF